MDWLLFEELETCKDSCILLILVFPELLKKYIMESTEKYIKKQISTIPLPGVIQFNIFFHSIYFIYYLCVLQTITTLNGLKQ